MWGISWPAEKLLASQKVLCSVECVSKIMGYTYIYIYMCVCVRVRARCVTVTEYDPTGRLERDLSAAKGSGVKGIDLLLTEHYQMVCLCAAHGDICDTHTHTHTYHSCSYTLTVIGLMSR